MERNALNLVFRCAQAIQAADGSVLPRPHRGHACQAAVVGGQRPDRALASIPADLSFATANYVDGIKCIFEQCVDVHTR